ncbi:hypothetical protein [Polyangium spumosum]|uniref:Helix-turn-helix domain-containing protein n=1 Tax=Polyangium spumosum TaxID=889282 RepID=A0A6N7PZI8_9BACT|nr:hypothetical protein [Polyangium spumosum]MRG95454.1 hypothetical protein [Polyangium spumosum]
MMEVDMGKWGPSGRRALEIAPDMLSQLTVLAVCGISPRVYLGLLRTDACSVRVVKLGKLRLVRRDEFIGWLESLGESAPPTTKEEPSPTPPADDPDTIDDLIRELGFRRPSTPPQRRSSRGR